jgi:photosystem II stability/assembly factor-like uncharacterized protein
MAFGKTYLAGSDGLFRVYNHSTSTWTDYSGFTTSDLFDVKTAQLPNFPDYAIIAGDVYIGYTTNAGATVTQVTPPVGSIAKAFQISIPESVSLNNPGIYIAGSGISSLPALIKSVDGGLTYTSQVTGLNTSFGSIARSVYFATVDYGILGHGGAIAKTINGAANWSYLNGGAVLAAGEIISGLLMSPDQQTIIAATDKKIYRSINGGTSFSVVYTWTNSVYNTQSPKYTNLTMYNPNASEFDSATGIWASGGNGPILYSYDLGVTWLEVFPGQSIVDDGRSMFGASFYSATEGFFTYDKGAESLGVVYKAANADISIANTISTDYFATGSTGYSLWSTQVIPGCGCPPGFTLDATTKQCIINTLSCPEGYTYGLDPISNSYKCIGSTVPCQTDIVLVIDVGGSISGTSDFTGDAGLEATNYKAFLNQIIDAIELGYDAAGNLNTPANSAHRISSDQVRVGIATFSNDGGVVRSLLPGTLDGSGYYSNKVTQLHSDISNLFTDAAGGSGGTNTIGGLAAAYPLLTNPSLGARIDNPIPPVRKMLLVTDGWPNTITSVTNFFGYNVTSNLPSTATSLSGCASSGTAPTNISENNFVFHNPITIPGQGIFTQNNYQVNQMWIYQRTMDFAQGLKTGSSSLFTDIAHDCDINLVVIGDSNERPVTLRSFVGESAPTYSIFTTPCTLDTKPYNDTVTVANGFAPSTANAYNPSVPAGFNCPDVYKEYPEQDGADYLKLPSSYPTGTPIVFSSDWAQDSLNSITKSVSNSLLCTDVIDPISCTGNCEVVMINNVAYCQCISADSFVPCCYTLTNCNTGIPEYTVNTYGLQNDYLNSLEGKIIKVTGLDKCLYVNLSYECTDSTEISIDAVEETFDTCGDCKEFIETPPCYLLTNCNNPDITLLSVQNLSTFSGKVVELNGYPGLCWTVLKTINCPGPFTTVGIVQSYSDCECCFQYQCK